MHTNPSPCAIQEQEPLESVPRLRLELKKALAEKEALERRLKLVLGRQRASYLPKSASGMSQIGASTMAGLSADPAREPIARAGISPQTNSQVLCLGHKISPDVHA